MTERTYVDRTNPLDTDPAGFLAYLVGLIESLLLVAQIAWGVDEAIVAGVLGVVQAAVPILAFVIVRGRAWAPATVAALKPDDVSTHPLDLPVPPAPYPPS